MRIFLAGAAGVIGRSLVPMLVEAGHEVVGTTRSPTRFALLEALGARPVLIDVFDRERLHVAIEREKPEVVIHQLTDLNGHDLAGNARLRVEGTHNLIDGALAVGVRRVIAQSIAFVSVPGLGPAGEDEALDLDAPHPRRRTVEGVYALEKAVRDLEDAVVLRYGTLYGAGTWYASDGAIAQRVRRGELPTNDAVTSFVHVADAARAALLALDWPAGTFNVVDDEPAPARDWLPVYAEALGAPAPPAGSGRRPWERGASNARARRELGWQPRFPSWREGFRTALG
ncbi:MAG: NAD-dependent epimerase/dehydratase family protein [Candidatus Dormibacteraceae bacterium]